jgi:Heparinase II/III-like protein
MEQAKLPAAERHSLQVGSLYGLASLLLACASHGQKPVSLLRDSGIALLRSGEASVVFCAMPNGLRGRGSHTHCDKLSIILRLGLDEVFSDSGSRWYTRSAQRRNLDRATRAHNTLMVDEADQNSLSTDSQLLFECGNEAVVSPITILESGVRASHQGYRRLGVEHQRTVQLSRGCLEVLDEVSGAGEHVLDLRFVLGSEWRISSEGMTGKTISCLIAGPRRLTLQCEAQSPLVLSILPAEISREYGSGLPTNSIRIHTTALLPAKVQTRVQWD